MKNDDDALRDELRDAAGRDLPGPELEARVMETIEGGGGEREIAVASPAPRIRRLLGVAAAVAVVALGLWAVASGRLERAPAGDAPEDELAADGIDLPRAETAVPPPRPIRIAMRRAEDDHVEIRLNGRPVDGLGDLRDRLARLAGDVGAPEVSERDVILLVDRSIRCREVKWVMQTCAHPEVRLYRLHFAVETADGRGVLPVFLPRDRGLAAGERRDMQPKITIVLKRQAQEARTRIVLLDRPLGEGEPGFEALEELVARIHRADRELPSEIDAWADVPYEDLVRVVDLLRRIGIREITFAGARMPVREEPK